MFDNYQSVLLQLLPSLLILAAMIAGATFVVRRWRDYAKGTDTPASAGGAAEMIHNFRELTEQGHLSDKEYRTIQAMLGEELKAKPPSAAANLPVGPRFEPLPGPHEGGREHEDA